MKDPKTIKDVPKISTYEYTRQLIQKKTPLKEISEERGISEDTIVGHIAKLYTPDGDLDIEYLRPDKELLGSIAHAIHDITEKASK